MSPRLPEMLILSSPSGAGRGSLAARLRRELPEFTVSISHTTRKPRPGEVDGREYHFVSPEQFDTMVARGEFAEWAHVHTSRYGTSKAEIARILASGHRVLFDIDWQGTRQLRAQYPTARAVFVLPPSMTGLAARLRGRKTDDEAEIVVRLHNPKAGWGPFGLVGTRSLKDGFGAAVVDLIAIARGEAPPRRAPTNALVHTLIEETV